MLKELKYLLNSYTDKELEEKFLWINAMNEVNYILVDKNNISLITENIELKIDDYTEQEGDKVYDRYTVFDKKRRTR